MDVFPWLRGIAAALLTCTMLTACGNNYDLADERGRRSRIDDANLHLSAGRCQSALASIWPLYNSTYVDDEVRLITASAYACEGSFNLLTLAGNLSNVSNPFQALAKSLSNRPNDGARQAMYRASDVLTRGSAAIGAAQRGASVNSYMVFVQLGIIGTIIRNYGSPAIDGSRGAALTYNPTTAPNNPAGEMTDEDACALAASVGNILDSFLYSGLTDPSTRAVTNQLQALCATIPGGYSCSDISQARTACSSNPANTAATVAAFVMSGVNSAW
ncbi:MAG: hypothetical protein EOP11_07005 [Proteobacteria bacterium]|nr:MAG: hypothetical protein EOP11_07005 [Pseudomonadota bacterium]